MYIYKTLDLSHAKMIFLTCRSYSLQIICCHFYNFFKSFIFSNKINKIKMLLFQHQVGLMARERNFHMCVKRCAKQNHTHTREIIPIYFLLGWNFSFFAFIQKNCTFKFPRNVCYACSRNAIAIIKKDKFVVVCFFFLVHDAVLPSISFIAMMATQTTFVGMQQHSR